jgi:hypothetical protein
MLACLSSSLLRCRRKTSSQEAARGWNQKEERNSVTGVDLRSEGNEKEVKKGTKSETKREHNEKLEKSDVCHDRRRGKEAFFQCEIYY